MGRGVRRVFSLDFPVFCRMLLWVAEVESTDSCAATGFVVEYWQNDMIGGGHL